MKLLTTTARKLAAGALVGATVLGGGAAYATASPAAHHALRPVRHHYFAGADHLTGTVYRNGTWETVNWDRGTVTAYTNDSGTGTITITQPDGGKPTFSFSGSTLFRGRTKADLSGDRAWIISEGPETTTTTSAALVVTLALPGKPAPAGVTGPMSS